MLLLRQTQQKLCKILLPSSTSRNIGSLTSNRFLTASIDNMFKKQPAKQANTQAIRWYRGDSGDMQHRPDSEISDEEKKLMDIAKPKYDQIQKDYEALPTSDENLEVRKKRLIYRSKQRGWLEVDLLLGTWASLHIPSLNDIEKLDDYESFVNMETIDIYNILTQRVELSEEHKGTVIEDVINWSMKTHPFGKASPDTYEKVKKDHNLI